MMGKRKRYSAEFKAKVALEVLRGELIRCHLGIGLVDHRVVEARFDHRDLGVVRHQQRRHAADRSKRPIVGFDPVSKTLRPARLGIKEVRRAEHRHKDLGATRLTGAPVNDDRHRVPRIIDEQLLSSPMRLAHRHR